MSLPTVEVPYRSLFRQPEVCEIAQVQPYVLRTWEAEFPELGVKKTEGGPRVYRRADLEFVLFRIQQFDRGAGGIQELAGPARHQVQRAVQVGSIGEGAADLDEGGVLLE